MRKSPGFLISIFLLFCMLEVLWGPVCIFPLREVSKTILLDIRLPRMLMVVLAGFSLSLSGATLQGMFRNPLVSPYLLGVASGAAFGASLGFLFSFPYPLIALLSFTFSLLAVFAALSISRSPLTLLLAGIAVSSFFSSLTSILQFLMTKEKLSGVVFWIMGGFSRVSMKAVWLTLPAVFLSSLFILLSSWRVDILSLPEDETLSLGVDPVKIRAVFVILCSLCVSSAVCFTGPIGWIGLIAPHIARILSGPSHRRLIPASMLLGGSLLLLADIVSRLPSGVEVPTGVVTALAGAPFLIFLLRRKRWDLR
ncbi:iron ABC transporter permease [bacterium]|nr:MAG: iron ABC transporter permease [bacterium]